MSGVSHSYPYGYKPLSSTGLLSPLVRILVSPFGLKIIRYKSMILFLDCNDSVHYRDGFIFDLVHYNISRFNCFSPHQEEDVSSEVWRFHAPTMSKYLQRVLWYLRTTTTGLSVLVMSIIVFQIINAEQTIMPKPKP